MSFQRYYDVIAWPQRWHQTGKNDKRKKCHLFRKRTIHNVKIYQCSRFTKWSKQTHWLNFRGTFWTKWRIAQLAYLLLRCDSSLRSEWQGGKEKNDRLPICHYKRSEAIQIESLVSGLLRASQWRGYEFRHYKIAKQIGKKSVILVSLAMRGVGRCFFEKICQRSYTLLIIRL